MPPSLSRPAAVRLAAACAVALGAWAGAGTLSLTSASGSRIGLLPPVWVLGVLIVLIGILLLRWRRIPAGPILAGAVLAVLPWLPVPVPAAFLIWTWPFSGFLLLAAILGLGLAHAQRLPLWVRARASDPRRAPWLIVLLSATLYGAAAWRVAPYIPGGDEPHYLVITQSLLYDGSLRIENVHTRGDYRAYHPGDLKPDYVQRGVDGEIYSIHMPGLSALVAPAFLLAGYPGTVLVIVLLAAAAGGLLWSLAFRVTGDAGAAWFGWAAAALSVPVVFHAFTLYPDSAGMFFVLVGLHALFSTAPSPPGFRIWPWIGYGAALAALPWLHSRFALVAGVFGVLVAWRLLRAGAGLRPIAAFLAVPVVSAGVWFWFFYAIYGSPDPRAQYGAFLDAISSPAYITSGIGGLFFDPQFGLLPYAPVFLAAGVGLMLMLARRPAQRSSILPTWLVALTLLLLALPYLVSTTTMRMWWGGWSAPGRFLVPLLPPLGIAMAVAWQHARRRSTRAIWLGALSLTIAASALLVWVDRGRLAYNVRQTDALWLEWAGPLAELSRGVPTFLRVSEPQAWLQTATWVFVLLAAWLGLRLLEGRVVRTRAGLATVTVGLFAAATMIAMALVWRLNDARGVEPTVSQVRLLEAAVTHRGIGLALDPLSSVPPREVPAHLSIDPPARFRSERERQITVLPGPLPAGAYAIEPQGDAAAGRVTVGIGRVHVPIAEASLSEDKPPIVLSFPVDVRALVVQGDEQAFAHVPGFTIRPQRLVPSIADNGYAVQARRYAQATAYFLDDRSFPEPPGFWVGGGRSSMVVVQPDRPGDTVWLRLRNAPVNNEIALASGLWRETLRLEPGEERRVAVPLDRTRVAARVRITVADGFRPSEHEPQNEDRRFLGVWVEVE